MLKPAKRKSLRGIIARGVNGLAHSINHGAMALAGTGMSGGYEGGRRDNRRSRSWRPGGGSPAADLLPDLEDLRSRSRDLERNSPLALGAIQTKVNGVVGTGLVLKSMLDFKKLGITEEQSIALQADIEREFELWSKDADFAGQLHFLDMQRLIYRSARVSGDIGIVRRYRSNTGKTYGTRLVLIEGDRICNPNRRSDSDQVAGGVQLAADGVVEGYHFTDRHPGEMRGRALSWRYVPRVGPSGMKQFLLPYEMQRPGQPRGIPLFAPIVELVKQLGDYTAAEINAAVHDAMLFAFETLAADTDDDHVIVAPESTGSVAGDDELQLADMAIITTGPGSGVSINKPSRPNTAFEAFQLSIIKQMGVALGIPFELMIMHFSSSFSASRGALEIAWKGFLAEKAWLEREVLDVVLEWVLTESVAIGRLRLPGFFEDALKRAAWLGRQWIGPTRIQINPMVEAKADEIDLDMGAKSLDQIITERTGGDFERKHAQRAHEHQARKKAGLIEDKQTAPPAPNDDGPDDEPADGNGRKKDK